MGQAALLPLWPGSLITTVGRAVGNTEVMRHRKTQTTEHRDVHKQLRKQLCSRFDTHLGIPNLAPLYHIAPRGSCFWYALRSVEAAYCNAVYSVVYNPNFSEVYNPNFSVVYNPNPNISVTLTLILVWDITNPNPNFSV